ncbi:MAG: isoprenylcysteine carboxylmethyltransferase family protein [Anderseniella sp.]|nr:isoprenylcysteine carboxylmethyltransferase family protein [Anderseniella sp.]
MNEFEFQKDARLSRLFSLLKAAFNPPAGKARIITAILLGLVCHTIFAVAVISMIVAMWFGLSKSFGSVPWPYAFVTNALLLVQFPLTHSLLLTGPGSRLLIKLVPGPHGKTLATTTYAIIASVQLVLLFVFWTPSGIVWWKAEGVVLALIATAYAASWLLLLKASFDAGAEVQSGALGWMSLMANIRPNFPDMPTLGVFRWIRQPIYVAFALTLWTVPTWTPDQLGLAVSFTAYCLCAPRLKEARFLARYGDRFQKYRQRVPYALPRLVSSRKNDRKAP